MSYGGSAALVVNKQETDRERRLRLRREEFAKRSGQDRQEQERLGVGGNGETRETNRELGMSEDSDPATKKYVEQQQDAMGGGEREPKTRESIWEAKKRRYLELRAKLRPEEQEVLDAEYRARADPGPHKEAAAGPVASDANKHDPQQQRWNAALPPARSGPNNRDMDGITKDEPSQAKMRNALVTSQDTGYERQQENHGHARREFSPQAEEYEERQQQRHAELEVRSNPSQHPPPRDPLREVQVGAVGGMERFGGGGAVQNANGGSGNGGGLFGAGLGFGGRRNAEDSAALKREYAAYLKQQMQEKKGGNAQHVLPGKGGAEREVVGVGFLDPRRGGAQSELMAGRGEDGAALHGRGGHMIGFAAGNHAAGGLLGIGDGAGGSGGGATGHASSASEEKRRQYAQELRKQAEDDKRRRELAKHIYDERVAAPPSGRPPHDAVRGRDLHGGGGELSQLDQLYGGQGRGLLHVEAAVPFEAPAPQVGSQHILAGDGVYVTQGDGAQGSRHIGEGGAAAAGMAGGVAIMDSISGARRSPGPHRSGAIRDGRALVGGAAVVGARAHDGEKEEAEMKKLQYAQELRQQVEQERAKKEREKQEQKERDQKEEEGLRQHLAREAQLSKIPRDQFGNPLPGHTVTPPTVAAADVMGEGGTAEPAAGNEIGEPAMVPAMSGVGSARKGGAGKGGVAARAVKEEGMPIVVSHEVYKAQIEEQIAEKKRQEQEQKRKEEEEERRDNERLERQIQEMQQQAAKEQMRRQQKEQEAEVRRQALLAAAGTGTGGGGGQLLARTPLPSTARASPPGSGEGAAGKFLEDAEFDAASSGGQRLARSHGDDGGGNRVVESGCYPRGTGAGGASEGPQRERPSFVEPLPASPPGVSEHVPSLLGSASNLEADVPKGKAWVADVVDGEDGAGEVPRDCLRSRAGLVDCRGGDASHNAEDVHAEAGILKFYGAEGSVEQTLAVLRADLVREHTRLQQELGLAPASNLAVIGADGSGTKLPAQRGRDEQQTVLARMGGSFPAACGRALGQDAARAGRAWAGGKRGSSQEWADVSEFVNLRPPREIGQGQRRRWGEQEQERLRAELDAPLGGRNYFQELLESEKRRSVGGAASSESNRAIGMETSAGLGSLAAVGSVAAAREQGAKSQESAGGVSVAGVMVPDLEPQDARYLQSPGPAGWQERGRDLIKNPAKKWVLNSADLKYLRASVEVETAGPRPASPAPVSSGGDSFLKIGTVLPPTQTPTGDAGDHARPVTAQSLPAAEALSPSLALNVAGWGVERFAQGDESRRETEDWEAEKTSDCADSADSGAEHVASASACEAYGVNGGAVDGRGVHDSRNDVAVAEYRVEGSARAKSGERGVGDLRTEGDATDFKIEKGRKHVALREEDDDVPSPGTDDACQQSALGDVSYGEADDWVAERADDIAEPQRCVSPDVLNAAGRQKKSGVSLAEQSLTSASALVAPNASLSIFVQDGTVRGGLGRLAEEDGVTAVRDSVGSGVHSVGEVLALPAGARGLGTPNSLRRAAAIAESLFDDSFENGDVFAKDGPDTGLDKSLAGASFLVSLKKARGSVGRDAEAADGAHAAGLAASREGAYLSAGGSSERGAGQGEKSAERDEATAKGYVPNGRGRGRGGKDRPLSASKVTTNRLRAAQDGEIDYLLKKFVAGRADPRAPAR